MAARLWHGFPSDDARSRYLRARHEGLSRPRRQARLRAIEDEQQRRSRSAADRLVTSYLDARDGARTDGAPAELDCLEALYRDLLRDVFEAGSSLRVPRPDAVSAGLRDPTMALLSFVYDLARAARDPGIDSPYRERAVAALAVAMVIRAALPDGETRWREHREDALRHPEPGMVEQYRRLFGQELRPWPPRMVPPDLLAEITALTLDDTLPVVMRDLARKSLHPLAPLEFLGFTRECRATLAGLGTDGATGTPSDARRVPRLTPTLDEYNAYRLTRLLRMRTRDAAAKLGISPGEVSKRATAVDGFLKDGGVIPEGWNRPPQSRRQRPTDPKELESWVQAHDDEEHAREEP